MALSACTAATQQSQRAGRTSGKGNISATPSATADSGTSAAPQPAGTPGTVPPATDTYGPNAGVAAPAGAVAVTPANFVATARAAAAGAVFVLTPGVYTGVSLQPKDGQQFFGQVGAILDGQNRTRNAFTGGAKNVRISNLVIRAYTNPAQEGAIEGSSSNAWEVDHNEITETAGLGLRVGPYMNAHDNWVHHNHQLGVGGSGPNIVVAHNDISFNNYKGEYDPGWEAGGSKWTETTGLVVKSNNVHNNVGPGLWTDIGNRNTTYDGNWVHDNDYNGPNSSAGIFHEISGSAVIKNNLVVHNGSSWNAWAWNAGIQIAGSSDVEIYGNQVLDNSNGISLLQQNRYGEWAPGVRNINVHDNIVRTKGITGFVQDTGENVFNGSRNVKFSNNTYVGGTYLFAWNNQDLGPAQWQATGNDATGSFK